MDRLAGTKDDAEDRREKVQAFLTRFASRAFRRPLSAEDRAFFIDPHLGERPDDLKGAVKRIVLLKFQGAKNGEVAEELQCTQRTIERKLERVRRIWEEAGLHDRAS